MLWTSRNGAAPGAAEARYTCAWRATVEVMRSRICYVERGQAWLRLQQPRLQRSYTVVPISCSRTVG